MIHNNNIYYEISLVEINILLYTIKYMKNLYDILEINKNASTEEIRSAYKKLALIIPS